MAFRGMTRVSPQLSGEIAMDLPYPRSRQTFDYRHLKHIRGIDFISDTIRNIWNEILFAGRHKNTLLALQREPNYFRLCVHGVGKRSDPLTLWLSRVKAKQDTLQDTLLHRELRPAHRL